MFNPNGPTFREQVRQALSSTQRGYDLLAPKFEFTPYRTPDWMLDSVAKILSRSEPFDSALDVCCGTGAGMRMLRPLAQERVVGIDFSEGMLAEGQQLLGDSAGDAELEFVHGDALGMSFESQFDVATCFGALGHIVGKNTEPFLQRVRAALKPGGRFIFISGYRPSAFSLAFWFSHGFNLAMRIRNLLVRPKFIMFYLTFLLPKIQRTLEANGFRVEVEAPEELGRYRIVVATRVD
ncbi:MAG: ubiquinone/menaquinone biosynthesis C-methylase UbiE [Verrucomicrobiales bacterium]|jgi:ubiquinone/menaquinone biosynthesis C-methylase UbiE